MKTRRKKGAAMWVVGYKSWCYASDGSFFVLREFFFFWVGRPFFFLSGEALFYSCVFSCFCFLFSFLLVY